MSRGRQSFRAREQGEAQDVTWTSVDGTGERTWLLRVGTGLAAAAFAAALIGAVYLYRVESSGVSAGGSANMVNGSWVTSTWQGRVEPSHENDAVFRTWAIVLVSLTGLGLVAAIRRRLWILLAVAGALLVISVLGLWSIGIVVAPAAVLLLLAYFVLVAGGAVR